MAVSVSPDDGDDDEAVMASIQRHGLHDVNLLTNP